MTIKHNYQKRKEDIEEAYKLLTFILSVETHRNLPLKGNIEHEREIIVTQEMQCVLKAQFLIVLYNMVESTVCNCLNSIYDAIADDGLEFIHLSSDMKTMWRKYLNRRKHPNENKTELELEHMTIRIEELAVNISGSLDFRKIKEIFKGHGCQLDDSKREDVGESFLIVKSKRNLLAHGNISFSSCGSNYLLSELDKFQKDIVSYMEDVVYRTCNYIRNKKYRT